jgi:hypothetical protein
VEALAALGPQARDACPDLEKVLLQDTSAYVRKSAARALGELGSKHSEATLLYAAQHDNDKFVRLQAEQAIEALATQPRIFDECLKEVEELSTAPPSTESTIEIEEVSIDSTSKVDGRSRPLNLSKYAKAAIKRHEERTLMQKIFGC